MGKLLILKNYIFLIYASDIVESRRHIHVTYSRRGFKKSCKFWLEPTIELDDKKKGEFSDRELREIAKLIHDHKATIMNQLSLFYQHQEVKAIRL
jgi:hypothetical protein